MSTVIYWIIFGYVLPMIFCAYCLFKLTKNDLNKGLDLKLGNALLSVICIFTPLNWIISMVCVFSEEFRGIVFPSFKHVKSIFDIAVIKGERK